MIAILCTIVLLAFLALLRCCDWASARPPINCPCNPCELGFHHVGMFHYAMASEFTTDDWIEQCFKNGHSRRETELYLKRWRIQ